MPKTVGYMLTWTTYGTWLQGDEKGYVKNGRILTENKALENSNLKNLKTRPVYPNIQQREAVRNAIIQEAKHHNQKILEIVVCSNHVHLVADYTKVPIDKIAWAYKFASVQALHQSGMTGKVWTKGYDRKFCFDMNSLHNRMNYVKNHKT